MRRAILIAVAVALVPGAVAHRAALADFRQIEADFVAARQGTACATRELRDYAAGARDLSTLETDVLALIERASADTRAAAARYRARGKPFPYPWLRSAHAAVGDSLGAQVTLYQAMVDDPAGSGKQLTAFSQERRDAETAIRRARSVLFVPDGAGWSDRDRCQQP